MAETYTLPKLPYAYDALEPAISGQVMKLHHTKHHQTYVTNLNTALSSHRTAVSANDVPAQIALQPAIRFNGGGHINHSLFWRSLAPYRSPATRPTSAPKLTAALEAAYGSVESFISTFNTALLGIQGSGWGWLVKLEHEGGRLAIVTTRDQDPVVGAGEVPVLGVDMWEHAHYLQYLHARAAYVKNVWKVVDWGAAEARFLGRQDDAFKMLKANLA